MDKKKIALAAALLLVVLYFLPMNMADSFNEDRIHIGRYSQRGVVDGEPYIDSLVFNDITREQRQEIRRAAENYSYRRTVKTYFRDGYMGAGRNIIHIYTYNRNKPDKEFIISDNDNLMIEGKTYRMKNSARFIEEVLDIMENR